MALFKVKACITDYAETEIEAESEDEAKELFIEMYDDGEIKSEKGLVFFEEDEGYEVIKEVINANSEGEEGEVIEDEEEEDDCEGCN